MLKILALFILLVSQWCFAYKGQPKEINVLLNIATTTNGQIDNISLDQKDLTLKKCYDDGCIFLPTNNYYLSLGDQKYKLSKLFLKCTKDSANNLTCPDQAEAMYFDNEIFKDINDLGQPTCY